MTQNADEQLDAQDQDETLEENAYPSTYENDSNDEEASEEEQSSEETGDDGGDEGGDDADGDGGDTEENEVRDRLNRAHRQIERLKGENARLKNSPKGSQKGSAETQSSLEATEKALLAAYGHKARDDQEIIKEYARKGGMTVAEALDDEFVMSRFEHTKKKAEVRKASARPSGKGKTAKRSAAHYIERGTLPKDPEAARAVRKELARRSAEGYSTQ